MTNPLPPAGSASTGTESARSRVDRSADEKLAEIRRVQEQILDDLRAIDAAVPGPYRQEVEAWERAHDCVPAPLDLDECGGMIRVGVCTLPFGHAGECGLIAQRCGLEIDGKPCIGQPDHPEPCRDVEQ